MNFARDACLHDPVLIAILVAANMVIALSYVSIPLSILWVIVRSPVLPFPAVWWLFGAFIVSCSLTHAAAALVFFRPAWHLEAALCVLTGVVSALTAIIVHKTRGAVLAAIEEYHRLSVSISVAQPTP
jgi:hypothetical protein